LMHILHID